MVKRSLQASLIGIQQAKRAFAFKGWTQDNLACEVNLKTRQPIWRFFSGRPVDNHTFIEICSVLSLNWREIATNPPAEFRELEEYIQPFVLHIDTLVQQVRCLRRATPTQRFDKIQDQCGILQLLDISRLVAIDDIYIDVMVSSCRTAAQRLRLRNSLTNFPILVKVKNGLGYSGRRTIQPGLNN